MERVMNKYKGVVFFDYDGTTVDEVDDIATATPKTVESLNKLKENGYLTMLCSGRTHRFLEMELINSWERSHVMDHIQRLKEK